MLDDRNTSRQVSLRTVMLIKYISFAKLATLQATRMFSACPAKVTNPPPPPPPFSSAYRSNLACGYLHLQRRPPHLIFLFYFLERPPAPVANASTSLPLLAAQADQALQPFSPNITNYVACSRSKREAPSARNMSEIEVFRDESPTDSSDPPAAVQSTSDPQDNSTEPVAAIRARRPSRITAANASKRRSPPSPSPPRQQPPSPASSYASVFSHAPSAENWTVAELRQVLTSAGVIIPRRSSKSDLLALYNSLQSGELQKFLPSTQISDHSEQEPQITLLAAPAQPSLPQGPARSGRPSASLGRAPDAAALSPHLPRASTERQLATQPSEEPAFASTSRLTRTSTPPSAAYSYTQPRTNEPLPYPWPAAPPLTASPTPSAQAPAPVYPPPPLSVHQALSGSNLPQSSTQTPAIPPLFHAVSSVPGAPFSLSTASPLPIPPNALALEPPPVANSIRSQILPEIQNIGTGGRSTPHPSTSLFRTDIPLNHPLKPLLEASLNSILQAVSPRTLQSYLTAWKSFKTFHSTYNLPFPTFSLLAITSFISHLNINKTPNHFH